jgi:hypothetical protein
MGEQNTPHHHHFLQATCIMTTVGKVFKLEALYT